MTEAEWLTSEDPLKMLKRARFHYHRRKSRLFSVAVCRRIWHLLVDERSRRAVEVAERHADGAATDRELRLAAEAAQDAHREMFDAVGKVGACIEWAAAFAADPNSPFLGAKSVTWMAARPRAFMVRSGRPNEWHESQLLPCTVTRRTGPRAFVCGRWHVTTLDEAVATGAENPIQAAILRDIFGNPFRPLTLDPSWLRWHDGFILQLAQSIYDDRRFGDLPILGDALEDAGCTNADLLDHCRRPTEHVRGCWVVDLLLGKE